jgi:hypothetical protein
VRVRETDPILSKKKSFAEKKSFREFQRVRESNKYKKRKQTLQAHRHVSYSGNTGEEIFNKNASPISKLLDKP